MLTARSECLDWVLVRSEGHAKRLLREFVANYNQERSHPGITLEQPVPKVALHQFGSREVVERGDRLGGLLHEYRVAAWLWTGYNCRLHVILMLPLCPRSRVCDL